MRKLRYIPVGGALVEVTTRTQQGRFLLRSSQEFNQIATGVLALALKQAEGIKFCGAAKRYGNRKGQHPKTVDPMDFATFYEVPVEPLPGWADRPVVEYRAYVADLVEQIEQATWERRRRDKPSVLGRPRILNIDPQHRPEHIKRSPAPAFHAVTAKALKALKEAYAWFVEAYRHAAEELKKGNLDAVFPGGCFPPGLPFVPG